MSWSIRPAGPDDADILARNISEGFESYRSFAPPGWEPPDRDVEAGRLREELAAPEVWALLAEDHREPAGHVALMPAARHAWHPSPERGLLHFWQLFVRRPWWGGGLATELHDLALREARARGYVRARLFTPAGQARARRFYEREGWTMAGPTFEDAAFGMELAELRLELRGGKRDHG